jgi:hypothetical protein
MCQGDIWESVPIVLPSMDTSGRLRATCDQEGPALLATHGCALDKATRSGQSTIERLQFLPLLALAQQDRNRQTLLRREEINPPEAVFVGDVPGIGNAFCLLSEMYWLPARWFDPELVSYDDHPDAEEGTRYLTAHSGGTRLGRLEDERLSLLHQKMRAFWTRFIAKDQANP